MKDYHVYKKISNFLRFILFYRIFLDHVKKIDFSVARDEKRTRLLRVDVA